MSGTPAKTLALPIEVKTSGGIRKSLLTPCRRLGLSRVVKTPASLEKPGKPTESPLICTTPVNGQSISNNCTNSHEKTDTEKKVVGSLKKPRKVVKKCLLLDEEFKNDVGDSPKRIMESDVLVDEGKSLVEGCKPEKIVLPKLEAHKKCSKKVVQEPKKPVKKYLLPQDETVDKKAADGKISPDLFSNSPQNLEEKNQAVTKSPDFKGFAIKRKSSKLQNSNKSFNETAVVEQKREAVLNNKKSNININISDAEDDDFQPTSKPKKIRRISSSSDSIKDKPVLKEITSKNSSENVKASLKKRLSMKKSKCSETTSSIKCDSESEFLPSPMCSQSSETQENKDVVIDLTDLPLLYEETETKMVSPPDENDFYEVNERMLEEIEGRIKEKEGKLDGLKRAEVYLKKHKVEELNDLRRKWKGGCCEALKDLLGLLRRQGDDVSMGGLLKMLNVPGNMITYNLESDELL